MQKSPAYSHYVRDALSSTRLSMLTGNEFKAFHYLLWNAWLQEPRATLPNDDATLAAMARLRLGEWECVKHKVLGMFVQREDGRLENERQAEVSETQEKHSKQNRINILRRYSKPKSKDSKNGAIRKSSVDTEHLQSRRESVDTESLPILEDEQEDEHEQE